MISQRSRRNIPAFIIGAALIVGLSGCIVESKYSATDEPVCCQTDHPEPSPEVPTEAVDQSTAPVASLPVPIRVYDISAHWTDKIRETAREVRLSALPLQSSRLPEFTHYSLAPGRCRIQADPTDLDNPMDRVELRTKEAVLAMGQVVVCLGPEAGETVLALVDATVLQGATWTYR